MNIAPIKMTFRERVEFAVMVLFAGFVATVFFVVVALAILPP